MKILPSKESQVISRKNYRVESGTSKKMSRLEHVEEDFFNENKHATGGVDPRRASGLKRKQGSLLSGEREDTDEKTSQNRKKIGGRFGKDSTN